MPNFAGTWKMRSSENFDELLKALGEWLRGRRRGGLHRAGARGAVGQDPRGALQRL